jgi:hypothetical protein
LPEKERQIMVRVGGNSQVNLKMEKRKLKRHQLIRESCCISAGITIK